ncbi:MAG: hypothetical protein RI909_1000 [Bacteroidota bacterium]|jgi:hypothetical protein
MYADLHSHPAAFAYDHLRLQESDAPRHPWAIPPSNPDRLLRPRGQAGYSQSDLAKCLRSNTRLLFASLAPIEKGFFTGIAGSRFNKQFMIELHERWHNEGEKATRNWLLKQLRQRYPDSHLTYAHLQFLGSRSMNFKSCQVKKLQNGHYDYFDSLKEEYRFFLERSGQYTTTPYEIQIDTTGIPRTWRGAYTLAANSAEINIDPDGDEIFIVPTLGGIHSLGVGNPEDADLRPGQQPKDVDLATIKSRIRQIKGEEALDNGPVSRWQHRPFYITFAQHFYNTLCGHAKGFSFPASLLFDQRKGLDTGANGACLDVWCELLGLSKTLEPTGSARILIDVHHMSAAARHDYYKKIIEPHNRIHKENPIPVIASHAGYAGTDYLQNQIDNCKNGLETDHSYQQGFLNWSINLCDEDVLQIFNSQGMLGLSLDYHLLGGGANAWLDHIPFAPLMRKRALNLIKRTLQQFIRIPFDYQLAEPHSIWERIALGSGFDGFMQPMERYSSVLQFETFEQDLVKVLHEMKHEDAIWFGSYRCEDLARMICFKNAYVFVKKHY